MNKMCINSKILESNFDISITQENIIDAISKSIQKDKRDLVIAYIGTSEKTE